MAPSVTVEKVSEEYQDYILTAGFLCTLTNYMEFVESTHRRQVVEKQITVTDGIIGKLLIYPTGSSHKFDGYISIYAGIRWKKSKAIVMKFDSTILNHTGKRILFNGSENFEKVPANFPLGDPEVMHSNLCYDRQYKILSQGCVMILVHVSVNIEMMIHPDMLDKFEKQYSKLEANLLQSFQDPTFGDTVLVVNNRKYFVERDVLIRGNPMFGQFFAETAEVDGCYGIMHHNPEVILHILVDCYLNGGKDDCDSKRSFLTRRLSYVAGKRK